MWDPTSYLRYGDERSRPFHDLIARVKAVQPRSVVDLGCGPGNLTTTLVERWPAAAVTGLDSSPEMISKAAALGSTVTFAVADVRDWLPAHPVDVVVCNAVLQWIPDHLPLLTRWVKALPPGAWLAVQVPGNFDAASHRALREVAAQSRWSDQLEPLMREAPVLDAAGYAALLTDAGCAVDAWETTYVHLLPAHATDHPVLRWMEGTALRPVRAALSTDAAQREWSTGAADPASTIGGGAGWTAFRSALNERLVDAYPTRGGQVYFPFRRIFFVARTDNR